MEIRRECGKCTNGIIRAFMHIQNGQCFACKGRGYFVTTEAKEARKAKRKAAKKAEADARAIEYASKSDALVAKYHGDPRLGPDRKAMWEKHDCVARETAELLNDWDTIPGWAEKYHWIARNLAR